ncbi:hypothetical protein ACFQZI_16680 [Mucilaginibacter lutimaris]|uniref:Bacteriocin-like protein n=1 Tax=Mucilaginibacter lutimaris TaxID=931629 RepID=A0ABW2ZJT8_9SPHI
MKNFGTPLSRGEMKNVMGGLAANCTTHSNCSGSTPICVLISGDYGPNALGMCCSAQQLHDKNHACGGAMLQN